MTASNSGAPWVSGDLHQSVVDGSLVRVLVVDDERAIRRLLQTALTANDYLVVEAESGGEALAIATMERPDLIVLDLGLPDMDGIELTRRVREWSRVPIIVLTVRDHERDKIAALDAGADDYLTKPFRMGELLARMRVALRRMVRPDNAVIFSSDRLVVDLSRRHVSVAGREVQLTPTEYAVLRNLVTHAGKVLTHRYLLRQVWGERYEEQLHLLRVNVSNLRRKLEPEPSRPRYIATEPGVGYRLVVHP